MPTRKQIAMLHVAKKRLDMADDDYRAILRQEAGVESSRLLDADGVKAVLRRFGELGFTPSSHRPDLGLRPGMATPKQVALIRSLWRQYTDAEGDDRSLGKWLQRTVEGLRYPVRHLWRRLQGHHGPAGYGEAESGVISPPPLAARLAGAALVIAVVLFLGAVAWAT